MSSAIVLPDVESLVVQFLKANPAVNAIVSGRVSGELPPRPTFPAITIMVVSDTVPIDWRLSAAWVQVDAYGTTREEARGLARIAHAEIIAWVGSQPDGSVVHTTTIQGVKRISEPADDRPRYQVNVRVWAHP